MICHSRQSSGIKPPENRSLELALARITRHRQRDRPPSLPKILFERFPSAQTTEDMRALMPQHVDKSLLPSLPKPKLSKK
jgi:hypothetical protein